MPDQNQPAHSHYFVENAAAAAVVVAEVGAEAVVAEAVGVVANAVAGRFV